MHNIKSIIMIPFYVWFLHLPLIKFLWIYTPVLWSIYFCYCCLSWTLTTNFYYLQLLVPPVVSIEHCVIIIVPVFNQHEWYKLLICNHMFFWKNNSRSSSLLLENKCVSFSASVVVIHTQSILFNTMLSNRLPLSMVHLH